MRGIRRKKEESMFYKFLYLFIVVIGFAFAFALLINKQQTNNLADIKNSDFHESTIMGKQIVARDLDTIYPKYYIALFFGNDYVVHEINYFNTGSQFDLEFSRFTYTIVDYDRSQKMIRREVVTGKGFFTDVLNDFASIVSVDHIEII